MKTSCPISDYLPAVSVSLEFGEKLKNAGKRIDVDIEALSNVLGDQGVPQEKWSDVSVAIESPWKFGRRGRAWTDHVQDGYGIAIYPTSIQRQGLRGRRLQRTIVHEARHVGDYVGEQFLESPENCRRHYRNVAIRKWMGIAACTTTSILMLPETTRHIAMPIIESASSNKNELLLDIGVALPLQSVFGAFMLSKWASYRLQKHERNAFKTARKTAANYPQIISFNKI